MLWPRYAPSRSRPRFTLQVRVGVSHILTLCTDCDGITLKHTTHHMRKVFFWPSASSANNALLSVAKLSQIFAASSRKVVWGETEFALFLPSR